MKRNFLLLSLLIISVMILRAQSFTITVSNPSKNDKKDAPVVLKLKEYTTDRVRSAVVTFNNQEIPSQLDDLNGDGSILDVGVFNGGGSPTLTLPRREGSWIRCLRRR